MIVGQHLSQNTNDKQRLAKPPSFPPENATPLEEMQHRLKTEEGKNFYGKRKSTVKPVFGIIKEIMEFKHFMLRGFETIKSEWTLDCL